MEKFFQGMNNEQKNPKAMAPLVLAYIGDAIFEAHIRNYLITDKELLVNELHKRATKYVKAKAQAEIVHGLEDELTEEEWKVVKKGRNQKTATSPKNSAITDYRYATGFEALIGYLFYKGETERLTTIMNRGIEIINKKTDTGGSK